MFSLHVFQFLLVFSRSEVPELSVVTFCCHVNDETLIDVVICELVCEL